MDGQAYGWNNSKGNISILTKIIRILRDLDHDDTHFSKYVSNLINGYRDMALDSQKIAYMVYVKGNNSYSNANF